MNDNNKNNKLYQWQLAIKNTIQNNNKNIFSESLLFLIGEWLLFFINLSDTKYLKFNAKIVTIILYLPANLTGRS